MTSAVVEVVGTLALICALIGAVLVAGAILNNRGITPPPNDLLRPGRRAQSPCPVDGSDQVEGGGSFAHRIRHIDRVKGDHPRVHCWCGDVSQPLSDLSACHAWMVAHRAINAWLDSARRDVEWSASINNTRRQA